MSNQPIDSVQNPSKNFRIFIPIALGLLFNIVLWALTIGKFGYSQDPIPLHFNIVYGIDYIGASYNIYQIPLLGLIILLLNFWLARVLNRREKLLSHFLLIAGALTNAILLIADIALIILNK